MGIHRLTAIGRRQGTRTAMVRPIISLIVLALLAACGRERPQAAPATAPPTMPAASLPPAVQDAAKAVSLEAVRDRRWMVVPAPVGFVPESPEPQLRLSIVPESARLKSGAPLRMRLALQNVGGKAYSYTVKDSLLKKKAAFDSSWVFFVSQAGGAKSRLGRPLGGDEDDGEFLSASEAERRGRAAAAFAILHIMLAPGESLVSLPRNGTEPDAWVPAAADRLVDVTDKYSFRKPGRYSIEARHTASRFDAAQARSLDEEVMVSPAVEVEVVP